MGDRYMVKRILLFAMILMFVSFPMNAEAQTRVTKEDVYRTIRENMLAHKSEFTINMSAKTLKEIGTSTDLLKAAASIDNINTAKDGDYLMVTVSSWSETWKYNTLGKASITVSVKYRTTLSQEKLLDAKLSNAVKALKLSGKSDYEKVKAIHDYIVNRVIYDQSLTKYTAYSAIINKSAVCQGYAAAAYLMFLDAGIDSKIISGTADGGSHVWNIVEVDGKWYNIDLTWDDPTTPDGTQATSYDYFLKNAKAFGDHTRASEFSTREFIKAYPIAAESYQLN
jgi:transglutaminase-like putative cysteine protease